MTARRHDIDALRIGAFALLIIYHIGMFYVPWGWHVKSTYILPQLETVMGLLNPWRLTLLFLISGIATRLMSAKLTPPMLAAQRSSRLLIPLFFGIVFVVPPQSWAQAVEKTGYQDGFLAFWTHYLSFDQSFGIIVPTYNHLWFIAYLWLYTVIAIAFWRLLPTLDRLANRAFSGLGVTLIPIALFGAYRAFVFPRWGESHIIWADIYAHLHYGTAFVIGLLAANQDRAWSFLTRYRLLTLLSVPLILAVALPLSSTWEDQRGWRGETFAFLREAYAWIMICALLGYAHHYIRRGSSFLTTLSAAIFPFYIIHQTAIVLTGHLISPYRFPLGMEATIILGATVASCVAAYFLALKIPALRVPLGLKPETDIPPIFFSNKPPLGKFR